MKEKLKAILMTALESAIGLALFLIVLLILSILPVDNPTYWGIINYFMLFLPLIILYSLLFFLARIAFLYGWPLDLFYPLLNAFAAIFILRFLFGLFDVLENFIGRTTVTFLWKLYPLTFTLVFLVVLIAGYVRIFLSFEHKKKRPRKKEKDIEWDDVGEEFKEAIYLAARNLRESLDKDKKNKSKKRKDT